MSLNRLYLTDRFTLDSINQFPFYLTVYKFDEEDFCDTVRRNKELVYRLYRKSSIRLLNYLCGVSLKVNKAKITFSPGDVAFVVNFSNNKITVIDRDHAVKLVNDGKVQFYEVIV